MIRCTETSGWAWIQLKDYDQRGNELDFRSIMIDFVHICTDICRFCGGMSTVDGRVRRVYSETQTKPYDTRAEISPRSFIALYTESGPMPIKHNGLCLSLKALESQVLTTLAYYRILFPTSLCNSLSDRLPQAMRHAPCITDLTALH